MPQQPKPELRRIVIFLCVGGFNTSVCYALYAALIEQFAWNYKLALVGDYGFGIVLGYLLHRVSTFSDRKNLKQAFWKYTATLVAAFILNYWALAGLVENQLLEPLAAQGVAMLLAAIASYGLQKHWVFRSYRQPEIPAETTPRRWAA